MPSTVRGKARKETSIKITKDLADLVDRLIREGKVGYRSRQEFCNEAIRRLVDHYWNRLNVAPAREEER